MKSKHALLIDGNALIHRAWHALPRLTSPDGRVVNAVYGFATVLIKVLAAERPDYLAVCWDTAAPTYRHTAEPAYKAHREDQPDEFYEQFPLVKELVATLGGINLEMDGYEADDLIATAAKQFSAEDVQVTALTSDRDVWQVIEPHVRVMAFKKGVTDTIIYDEQTLPELVGLTPRQVADWKALSGDPSDNLKGVPGIGDKTALDLLKKFGTLDGVFAAAHDPKSDIKPGARTRLLEGEQAGRDTYKLVQLITDAPIKHTDEMLKRRPVNEANLRELFLKLGFKTLLARLVDGAKEPEKTTLHREASDEVVEKSFKRSHASLKMTSVSVDALLVSLKSGDELIVLPVEVAQESLFTDTPVLSLALRDSIALVSRADLEDTTLKKRLAAVFADEKIFKVGHQMKVAWHWCRKNGFELNGIVFDTEIAAYLLSSGDRSYDLPLLAAGRLDTVLPEGTVGLTASVEAIAALRVQLAAELKEQRLEGILTRFELPLIPVLGEMEAHGILIDRPYFKSLRETFQTEKSKLEREMVKLAGEEFNPASPSQLAHILFDVLQISSKGIKRGKTGISTAASELEKLEGAHPIIEKIGEYREVAKLLSTYVEALPLLTDGDGRVHTTFNQTIAATGRLSSTDPNLQNIPIRTELGREIRHGFIADPGYVLLSCDYSQIELRIIAALAKDEKMLDAFRRSIDIHTATAAAIWDVKLDEVTKDQRRAAKAINFGIIYGQGPMGLSKSAGISFDEAKEFIAEYFHVYAGIREYLDQTKAMAHAQGFVETLFGRRRHLLDINSQMHQLRAAAERMAINMPVQGTAADIMKLALIDVAKKLPELCAKARILLQVHDELVFEVPENDVTPTLVKEICSIMESVEKIGVPIVVEAKVGKNWDEMTRI